jgi:hypothetical protein
VDETRSTFATEVTIQAIVSGQVIIRGLKKHTSRVDVPKPWVDYTRLKDPYQAARSEERWPKCQKLNPFVVYKHRSDKCREQEVEAGEF